MNNTWQLKKDNFEFQGQSYLFWEYVRLLKDIHPKYFLLENVVMAKEWSDIISNALGDIYPEHMAQSEMFESKMLEPIQINSALVSAQNRKRLYWTNIQGIKQPEDKQIMLKDIIINADTDRDSRQLVKCGAIRGRNPENPKSRETGLPTMQMLELRKDEKTNTLTTVQKDNVLCKQIGEANIRGNDSIKRVYSIDGKGPCLTTMGGGNREPKISTDYQYWRKLTPLECERLQTLPDNYTGGVSNTQRYRCIGNGWTVDVIAHIFKFIA